MLGSVSDYDFELLPHSYFGHFICDFKLCEYLDEIVDVVENRGWTYRQFLLTSLKCRVLYLIELL